MGVVRKKVFTDLPPEMLEFYRAASAKRRRADKACESCGAAMPNVILKKRYCSNRCAVRAWRAAKKATPPASSPASEAP